MRTLQKLIKQLGRARARLIFISSPHRGSIEGAMKICRYWWNKGYVCICPRVMFSYMADDRDRAVIMFLCKILLWLCDSFALYGESSGCKEEYELAQRWGKEIFILYDDDVNFKKMMLENREVIL